MGTKEAGFAIKHTHKSSMIYLMSFAQWITLFQGRCAEVGVNAGLQVTQPNFSYDYAEITVGVTGYPALTSVTPNSAYHARYLAYLFDNLARTLLKR